MQDELTIDATVDNIPIATDYVTAQLEKYDCPMRTQLQITIAIDELFGNIARYAYDSFTGPATVRVKVVEDPLSAEITFIDHGIPYDPLAKDDPDLELGSDERQIGGLGIFMTKEIMDDIRYEYRDGKNVLTIVKAF